MENVDSRSSGRRQTVETTYTTRVRCASTLISRSPPLSTATPVTVTPRRRVRGSKTGRDRGSRGLEDRDLPPRQMSPTPTLVSSGQDDTRESLTGDGVGGLVRSHWGRRVNLRLPAHCNLSPSSSFTRTLSQGHDHRWHYWPFG